MSTTIRVKLTTRESLHQALEKSHKEVPEIETVDDMVTDLLGLSEAVERMIKEDPALEERLHRMYDRIEVEELEAKLKELKARGAKVTKK